MKMEIDILPECYVDTNLVATMLALEVQEAGSPTHCKGCNVVCGNMNSQRLRESFALGIIDEDKRQHSYMKEFNEIGVCGHIKLLKHKDRHHFIIMTKPAMDKFVWDIAHKHGINMNEYELPDTLKEFTRLTKDIKAKDSANMKRLFKKLKDDDEMSMLRNILRYLYNHRYSYDLKMLKSFIPCSSI